MGGAVGVKSEPGHGSTFWCTVRLQEAASGARARVLVVDDETSLGTLVRLILEPHGYDVMAVESGAAALEVLIEAPFDLILLDWQMPGMDGLEVARRVRAMQLATQPRLVMLTGFGDARIGGQATAAGIDRLMLKPFNPQLLLEEVGTISRVQSGAAPKAPGASKEDDREALGKIAGARILLVEDNELNQEVALGLMEEGGFVIDVAGNGQLAIERVLVGTYDIVLMDLQMPVLDGLSATVKLRAMPAFA
jgi:two-component system sensor histidine kinase/response regulator